MELNKGDKAFVRKPHHKKPYSVNILSDSIIITFEDDNDLWTETENTLKIIKDYEDLNYIIRRLPCKGKDFNSSLKALYSVKQKRGKHYLYLVNAKETDPKVLEREVSFFNGEVSRVSEFYIYLTYGDALKRINSIGLSTLRNIDG